MHLWWKPPPPPPCGEPELAAFQLRFSIDGGVSWQVGIENTDSPEPCARVGNLSPGHAYLFMVAAINAAGMGDFSPPSPPLHHSPDGITTAAAIGVVVCVVAAAAAVVIVIASVMPPPPMLRSSPRCCVT